MYLNQTLSMTVYSNFCLDMFSESNESRFSSLDNYLKEKTNWALGLVEEAIMVNSLYLDLFPTFDSNPDGTRTVNFNRMHLQNRIENEITIPNCQFPDGYE